MAGKKEVLLLMLVLVLCLVTTSAKKKKCSSKKNNICCDLVAENITINVTRCAGHHHGYEGCSEKETVPVNITVYRCVNKTCCPGWQMDSKGKCTIRTEDSVTCHNGGSPASATSNYCNCAYGYTGQWCETNTCNPPCGNTSICAYEDGHHMCKCMYGFTGLNCRTPMCEPACMNGGSCLASGAYTSCYCPPGYSGLYCEEGIKPGNCPSVSDTYLHGNKECHHDYECTGNEICCPSVEEHSKCIAPTRNTKTCVYKNKHYKQGEQVNITACSFCTCTNPSIYHDGDEFECYNKSCPTPMCAKGSVITHKPNLCCPVCEAEHPNPKAPTFTSCPRSVNVTVRSDRNEADLFESGAHKSFKAVNYRGEVLQMRFSKTTFRACSCSVKEYDIHHVTVTSEKDEYNREAVCSTTVKVVDLQSPTMECRYEIISYEDQAITWKAPKTKDNVGVKSLQHLTANKYKNGTTFPAGTHFITYAAKDFHENIGYCVIIANVYKRDDPNAPEELRRDDDDDDDDDEHEHRRLHLHIGLGVGAFLLLILFSLVAVCCCLNHRKRMARGAPGPATANTYDNNIYAVSGPPPAYDNVMKEKLPEYSVPGVQPPSYEEEKKDLGGIENPVYMDDVKLSMEKDTTA